MAELGIGLMSGTSGDGVDVALVSFNGNAMQLLATFFLPFSKKVREEIRLASKPDGQAELISRLNVKLGKLYGKAVVKLCKSSRTPLSKIDFIGSHGQTIRHQPNDNPPSTLQIGSAEEIAVCTGSTVVSDFRQADMAVGGCGAPLAPIAHFDLFRDKKETRIIHNIGGISNITLLKKGATLKSVRGFDTGPGNSLLDSAVSHFSRGKKSYDKNGKIASMGEVNQTMFLYCMKHPFFRKRIPKSTGKEEFGEVYFKTLLKRFGQLSKPDFLRTLTALTAYSSVSQAERFFKKGCDRWVVCGGGAYNKTLMLELKMALPKNTILNSSSDLGIDEKAVEPILMAILARRRIKKMPGNIPAVTGARKAVPLGRITFPL